MAKKRKINSQEVGLEIGLYFFKYFLKTEYLHYGYFIDGLETDILNLAKAQENYARFLLEQIPEGVKSILDVGGGSGKFADELIQQGYEVDFVSPSRLLNEYASGVLGERAAIHTKKFEDLDLNKKFDLVLFSESFQYIPIDEAIENAKKYLRPEGHILICDFFQRDEVPGKSALGGGHKWRDWMEKLPKHELIEIKNQDITQETAPTIDLVNSMTLEVLHPIYRLLFMLGEDCYPKFMKFIRWKYKKKLEKMENKHFKSERNGANFIKYKKYMMYLFRIRQ
jgi:SAM-dependent methyltransferase